MQMLAKQNNIMWLRYMYARRTLHINVRKLNETASAIHSSLLHFLMI